MTHKDPTLRGRGMGRDRPVQVALVLRRTQAARRVQKAVTWQTLLQARERALAAGVQAKLNRRWLHPRGDALTGA